MLRLSNFMTLGAFAVAAAIAYGTAVLGARWIEDRSVEAVDTVFKENQADWVEIQTDGLQIVLTGRAPTEASRFRVMTLAGQVVDAGRLIDAMDVVSSESLIAPKFSLEILRNDAGISLIGLIPTEGSRSAMTKELEGIAAGKPITDMVETADHPVPETWSNAVRYGLQALKDLPRSKISVEADRVEVTAVVDSSEEKRNLETRLARRKPQDVALALDISAPRPVITPFTLRLIKAEDRVTFDACSVDTAEAQRKIISAATAAGFEGRAGCELGLGVPSTRWADATSMAIRALSVFPGGTLTFSDADVTLVASYETEREVFDETVAQLKSDLPDVFSLQAILTPAPKTELDADKEAQVFTATLSPEGIVQMRGMLRDADQEATVLSFARAQFGVANTYIATQSDPGLPGDWTARVFAGLEGLSYLKNGALTVEENKLNLRGVTGRQSTKSDVSRILGDKLDQNAIFAVDVRYDEQLDPLANVLTPQDCVLHLNAVLLKKKITFDPGSATFDVSATEQLDLLAETFADCDDVPIEVGGYTDSQGREEMNRGLSQQRADAVRNALIDRGVPPGILIAIGYGESQPVADNDTEEGREANRRIAFALAAQDVAEEGDASTEAATSE